MEAICSSETSGETQRTTRRHITEDDTLYNHCCENLKSYIAVYGLETGITELERPTQSLSPGGEAVGERSIEMLNV
jgi:hypothetical protein